MRTTARREIVIETPALGVNAMFDNIYIPASSLGQTVVAKVVAVPSWRRWRSSRALIARGLPRAT